MWILTGKYSLERKFFGGYDVFVELQDDTNERENIWRKATHEEVLIVINK